MSLVSAIDVCIVLESEINICNVLCLIDFVSGNETAINVCNV